MSTSLDTMGVPALTLGWRLKMALGSADVSAADMANHLGVSRQTLSRWMGDIGAPPSRAFVLQWAIRTGVNAVWLESGMTPEGDGGGDGLTSDGDSTTTQEYSRTGVALLSLAS